MSSVPVEFLALGLDGVKFYEKRHNEYHGSCPFCGGEDRFRIHTDRPFPHWNWECRKCGRKGWADQLNPRLKAQLTPETMAEYVRKNQESEVARKMAQARLLDRYRKSRVWEKYHTAMKDKHRAWWSSQGIPDEWQDFWQLGWTPFALHRTINRQAYTIPKFGFGGVPTNCDYRIIDPPPLFGKYRPIKGLPVAPFISNPNMLDWNEVYIVEGSKKAMVLACHNIVPESSLVIGIPSCNSWAGIEKMAQKWEVTIWIMLDPGAEEWAYHLSRRLGPPAIVVTLPEKTDDMVLAGATRNDFLAYMRKSERNP